MNATNIKEIAKIIFGQDGFEKNLYTLSSNLDEFVLKKDSSHTWYESITRSIFLNDIGLISNKYMDRSNLRTLLQNINNRNAIVSISSDPNQFMGLESFMVIAQQIKHSDPKLENPDSINKSIGQDERLSLVDDNNQPKKESFEHLYKLCIEFTLCKTIFVFELMRCAYVSEFSFMNTEYRSASIVSVSGLKVLQQHLASYNSSYQIKALEFIENFSWKEFSECAYGPKGTSAILLAHIQEIRSRVSEKVREDMYADKSEYADVAEDLLKLCAFINLALIQVLTKIKASALPSKNKHYKAVSFPYYSKDTTKSLLAVSIGIEAWRAQFGVTFRKTEDQDQIFDFLSNIISFLTLLMVLGISSQIVGINDRIVDIVARRY